MDCLAEIDEKRVVFGGIKSCVVRHFRGVSMGSVTVTVIEDKHAE
jgi:hypothetical protein